MAKAILLSIHPKWAEKIYSGEKTLEWRKTYPKTLCFKTLVFLYETSPVKRITGTFVLTGIEGLDLVINPWLFEHTKREPIKKGCVDEDSLRKYQGYSKGVWGWDVENPQKFDKPKTLADFGLKRAPQSWQYVEEK